MHYEVLACRLQRCTVADGLHGIQLQILVTSEFEVGLPILKRSSVLVHHSSGTCQVIYWPWFPTVPDTDVDRGGALSSSHNCSPHSSWRQFSLQFFLTCIRQTAPWGTQVVEAPIRFVNLLIFVWRLKPSTSSRGSTSLIFSNESYRDFYDMRFAHCQVPL